MLSVVVTTYEWAAAVDLVLQALSEQTDHDFEVVVADDGSGPETSAVLGHWHQELGARLRHARQDNDGFRRARVLNLAVLSTTGDWLAFIDGDSLPRRDFVAAVRRALLSGWFLAGKRLRLGPELSRRALDERVPVWRWSPATWLVRAPREVRRPGLLIPLRDRRRPWRPDQPEFIPPYNGYGSPLVVSRADFELVNGFDMRFVGWGQEDEDIAARLRHAGLRCGWAGPKSTLLHLWHPSRTDRARPNDRFLAETCAVRRREAVEGLRELAAQLNA